MPKMRGQTPVFRHHDWWCFRGWRAAENRLSVPVFLAWLAVFPLQAIDCRVVPGWQQQGPTRSYTAENLFEYMDGNAEGYLIYGFTRMDGVTCASAGDTLLIDISEMGDSDSAYGIFTANRHPQFPVVPIGMAGQIQPRKAVFAKGRYYVEIAANPEKDHSAALRQFTTALEPTIPGDTKLPAALSWFATERLKSLRLVPESVLGLRALKRGYAAEYEFGKAFVVTEESPAAAAGVLEKVRARIAQASPAQVGDEGMQAADRYLGRLCFFRKGRYVAGYANVAEGTDPVELAKSLAARLP